MSDCGGRGCWTEEGKAGVVLMHNLEKMLKGLVGKSAMDQCVGFVLSTRHMPRFCFSQHDEYDGARVTHVAISSDDAQRASAWDILRTQFYNIYIYISQCIGFDFIRIIFAIEYYMNLFQHIYTFIWKLFNYLPSFLWLL